MDGYNIGWSAPPWSFVCVLNGIWLTHLTYTINSNSGILLFFVLTMALAVVFVIMGYIYVRSLLFPTIYIYSIDPYPSIYTHIYMHIPLHQSLPQKNTKNDRARAGGCARRASGSCAGGSRSGRRIFLLNSQKPIGTWNWNGCLLPFCGCMCGWVWMQWPVCVFVYLHVNVRVWWN